MTLKFRKGEYAGRNCDDGDADRTRSADVGRRVTEEHQRSLGDYFIRERHGILEYGLAGLVRVAKRSKGEVVAKAGAAQLGPADGFKVSCGNAQDLATVVQ